MLVALALGVAMVLAGCRPHTLGPSASTGQQGAAVAAMWVQLGPSGSALARAITANATCPNIALGSQSQAMEVRARASTDFPVLVCEAPIPPGTASAAIAGRPLGLPKPDPRRIVVIGDTGCHVERFEPPQACNDPQAWPFAQVARSAAAWEPDLVVHVGDYYYREMACPAKDAGCAGSPWGDNWAAWSADFFTPGAPLLRAAPWVFSRGNHEGCHLGWRGWFRFLEPRPPPASCQDYTEPYGIPVGDLQLLVLDSAIADDFTAPPDQVAAYAAQFAALNTLASPNAWLVTHRPLWAVGHASEEAGVEQLFRDNPTLQAASGNQLPPGVKLVLSGHLHLFEVLDFAAERPPQLVVGMSGTELDPRIRSPLAGVAVAGTTVASGTSIDRHGFLTIEPSAGGWTATVRDVYGSPELTCAVEGLRATCTP